jgi:hypothetical protein
VAQSHLRSKYEHLAGRNVINVAEDFISLAASKSSVSGYPYEVRCENRAPIASGRWLNEALTRFRARS